MIGQITPLGRVLVLAPHPDDEVLGCGGTIARLAASGHEVHVAIVTRGMPPRYREKAAEHVRDEALTAHSLLRVRHTHFLDQPAAELDTIPHAKLNGVIADLFEAVRPDTVFMPFHFSGRWQGVDMLGYYPAGAAPVVRGEAINTGTTYGYDSVTMMQETKTTVCNVEKA